MTQELQQIKNKLFIKVSEERDKELESFAFALCTVINDKCKNIGEGNLVFKKMQSYFDDSLVDYINEK